MLFRATCLVGEWLTMLPASQRCCIEQRDWIDSIDDWTVVGTHCVVRCRVHDSVSGVSQCARRGLFGNQLIGPIPTEIGQLAAINSLYVFTFPSACAYFTRSDTFMQIV
jgi:hypothetical protein